MTNRPANLVAVDPGGVHVGVALFQSDASVDGGEWRCWQTFEKQPQAFEDWLAAELGRFDVLVYERFTLYEDKALSLVGSEMETSQLIGVIRYLARLHPEAALVSQPAAWQDPTKGLLRHYNIGSVAKRTHSGPHCFSAELHGWAYLLRTNLTQFHRHTP